MNRQEQTQFLEMLHANRKSIDSMSEWFVELHSKVEHLQKSVEVLMQAKIAMPEQPRLVRKRGRPRRGSGSG